MRPSGRRKDNEIETHNGGYPKGGGGAYITQKEEEKAMKRES